jgi:hypothetical protein
MFDVNFDPSLKELANNELIEKIDGNFYGLEWMEDAEYIDDEGTVITEHFVFDQVQNNIVSGDGADINMTFKATHKDTGKFVFLWFEGSYSSWNSNHWDDDAVVVYPKQVTVTKYYSLKELEKESE